MHATPGANAMTQLEKMNVEQVTGWIERELAAPADDGRARVFATDADGTLWSGDIGEDLFQAFLAARTIQPAARDALAVEARDHDIDASGDAQAIAERL